jgi:hypothetical protein
MAKVFIEETTLTAIGDAIREKTGKTELIDPAKMSTEIASIAAGSGGGDSGIPDEAFTLTGDLSYRFSTNGWNWFVDQYGNKIKTAGLTNLMNAFSDADKLQLIPFTLNVSKCETFSRAFRKCNSLRESPKIRGTLGKTPDLSDFLTDCSFVRSFEDLFETDMLAPIVQYKVTGAYTCPKTVRFERCYSLRTLPSWWAPTMRLNPESTIYPAATYSLTAGVFNYCYVLDEARDIPVWHCQAAQTSNMFNNAFSYAHRLKAITFETNNGQPIEVQWKNQTINLNYGASGVGAIDGTSSVYLDRMTKYNSGITEDKRVTNDATYQALKNDPDWFTTDILYSRYNHDSAVETINSLPDTSAYLASAGGTNTINFVRNSGYNTDGGPCGALTAEEIAVAAAKGWTVTLV